MFHALLLQMKKTLGNLDAWLAAGATYAREHGTNPDDLLALRLAPDQFAFVRQVQIAGDTAKFAVSRLTGKDAPVYEDNETTIDELRARVAKVVAYLDGFSAADFEGAATRTISLPRWEGKVMTGQDYFLEHAVPNFFFHVTHTYALLRHHGVPLGKRDYLGAINLRDPQSAS
jgi:uncharacterized protein